MRGGVVLLGSYNTLWQINACSFQSNIMQRWTQESLTSGLCSPTPLPYLSSEKKNPTWQISIKINWEMFTVCNCQIFDCQPSFLYNTSLYLWNEIVLYGKEYHITFVNQARLQKFSFLILNKYEPGDWSLPSIWIDLQWCYRLLKRHPIHTPFIRWSYKDAKSDTKPYTLLENIS